MRTSFLAMITLGVLIGSKVVADEKGKTDFKAAVVGKWQSNDGDQAPAEFMEDGTAKVGLVKKDGKWLISTGKWTISDKGRVEFKGGVDGITNGQWWNLKDGLLVGPRGPKPMVQWVKVKKDDEKK